MNSDIWHLCVKSTKSKACDEELVDKTTIHYRMFKAIGAPENDVMAIKQNNVVVWKKEDGLPTLEKLLGIPRSQVYCPPQELGNARVGEASLHPKATENAHNP